MKYIIIVQWYTANDLYPHEAYIEQIRFVGSEDNGILACHGYNFEEFSDAFDRANSLGNRIIFSLYGRLAIDLFTCENSCYQIPKFELNLFELDLYFHAI